MLESELYGSEPSDGGVLIMSKKITVLNILLITIGLAWADPREEVTVCSQKLPVAGDILQHRAGCLLPLPEREADKDSNQSLTWDNWLDKLRVIFSPHSFN